MPKSTFGYFSSFDAVIILPNENLCVNNDNDSGSFSYSKRDSREDDRQRAVNHAVDILCILYEVLLTFVRFILLNDVRILPEVNNYSNYTQYFNPVRVKQSLNCI